MAARAPAIPKEEIKIFDISDELDFLTEQNILEFYRTNGLVVIKFLEEATSQDLIMEQWREVISQQPLREEYKIKVKDSDTGEVLDMDKDPDRFLKSVTAAPLPNTVLKEFEDGWPLHRGFGACCDPAVFHLKGVWKIRENPLLYKVACGLIGQEDIWVDINRSIQKLPKQGESEFLHWDMNPFSARTEEIPESNKGVAGKVCYTPSRFVAVLGSHTDDFHREFVSRYGELYPNVSPTASKFALDFKKPDPMNCKANQREYLIPPGCVVFWHENLLHGQVKTPRRDPIEYGTYLGYFPAGSRSEYERKCGVNERADRLNSYHEGRAPKLWPSGDKIHYYPKRFQNFPGILAKRIGKMRPGDPSITTRLTQAGKEVPHLLPIPNDSHNPPQLTNLGKLLLGARDYTTNTDFT